jgi:mRNA interferase RelE/StbE
MPYTIEFAPKVYKQLKALPGDLQRRIGQHIDSLALNPHPAGSIKIQGAEDCYRIRIGDYRVVYEIQDRRLLVYVLRIGHRRDVYR